MGITLVWENNEKTILRHIYEGQWKVEDLYKAVNESRDLLMGVEHVVDLIIDMRTSGDPPSGVLPAYQYAERQKPPNQGLVVMVEPSMVMQAFNQVIGKIAPNISKDRTVVHTIEDAVALIQRHRAATKLGA